MEGLDRSQFKDLGPKSREFIETRVDVYRRFKDATLVARLLQAVAEEKGVEKIESILLGHDKEGIREVQEVVNSFKDSEMEDIQAFYRKLKKKEGKPVSVGKKEKTSETPVKKPVEEKPEKPPEPEDTHEKTPEQHELFEKESKTRDLSIEERMDYLARELARWQDMPVDVVRKSEKDVIDDIIKLSNEKQIPESKILKACENMIEDEYHEAQFHLECLKPDHRRDLLERIKKL